jgi:predicted permease
VLLVAQVAISLVLLVGAGLFLRTLQNLRHVDVGFNPQNILLIRVNPSLTGYDGPRAIALLTQLLERLPSVPGVRAVALSQPALLAGSVNSTSIVIQARPADPKARNDINRLVVSANFFSTMEIPVLLGRGFTASDGEKAPKVALINEAAVRKYFAGTNPVGQRFGQSPETSGDIEIVGVVKDAKYNSVRDPAPPTMYVPYQQARPGSPMFEVRTAGPPSVAAGGLREAMRQVDPNLPVMDVSSQMEQIERRFAQERVFAQAYTLFGLLALVLASVGLFGLMSYNVARRTNEIGIRMALGAQGRDVLSLVMRESMSLVAIGVVAGLAIALAGGYLVKSLLFGLASTDGASIAGAVIVMVVVSAAAGYLPARRASKVDPLRALHYE